MQSRPECDIQPLNQDEHSPIIILWMGWAGTAGFGRLSKTLRVRRFRLAALFFFEAGRRRDYGNRREDEWRQIYFFVTLALARQQADSVSLTLSLESWCWDSKSGDGNCERTGA
jgi:hypothetical protein